MSEVRVKPPTPDQVPAPSGGSVQQSHRAAKGGKKPSPGQVLTADDILHYRRVIVALSRTAEIMPKIDMVIGAQGGWPGAFRGMVDASATEAAD